MKILFAAQGEEPARWLPLLAQSFPDGAFVLAPQADVEAAIVTRPPLPPAGALPRLRFVQSLWMGVDRLLAEATLPAHVPLARCLDPGMIAAMTETVLACVLDWHRDRHRYRRAQAEARWQPLAQHLAADRTVGLLGYGVLGQAAARALAGLGFEVLAWTRKPSASAGVASSADLEHVLAASDILVCLLPLTPATRGLLDRQAFARMKKGAALANLARGEIAVEHDLLAALDERVLSHAYLDVFAEEPLPPAHPFWRHPAVTVTPHVAALTDPRTAAPWVAANLARVARCERPLGLVDRARGY